VDGTTLRDGIFALQTRRFGSVAEVMVQRLINAAKARSLFHDLYDDARMHRIEVKFSRVQKQSEMVITQTTVLQCIADATAANRLLTFDEWPNHQFDCNIQQIKRTEFEILYYGLLFSDCVKIFRIKSSEIGSQIYYSDKQHKGNVGEGQFHVNHDTIQIHLDNYLYKTLTYEELYELLSAPLVAPGEQVEPRFTED
jgi:hypothetical protein